MNTRDQLYKQVKNSVFLVQANNASCLTRRKFLGGNQISSHYAFNNINQIYTRNRNLRCESRESHGRMVKSREGFLQHSTLDPVDHTSDNDPITEALRSSFDNKRIALKSKGESI